MLPPSPSLPLPPSSPHPPPLPPPPAPAPLSHPQNLRIPVLEFNIWLSEPLLPAVAVAVVVVVVEVEEGEGGRRGRGRGRGGRGRGLFSLPGVVVEEGEEARPRFFFTLASSSPRSRSRPRFFPAAFSFFLNFALPSDCFWSTCKRRSWILDPSLPAGILIHGGSRRGTCGTISSGGLWWGARGLPRARGLETRKLSGGAALVGIPFSMSEISPKALVSTNRSEISPPVRNLAVSRIASSVGAMSSPRSEVEKRPMSSKKDAEPSNLSSSPGGSSRSSWTRREVAPRSSDTSSDWVTEKSSLSQSDEVSRSLRSAQTRTPAMRMRNHFDKIAPDIFFFAVCSPMGIVRYDNLQ